MKGRIGREKIRPGIFTICVDLEMAWGFGFKKMKKIQVDILKQGRNQLEILLNLFRKYQISVTWAIVGGLLLEDYRNKNQVPCLETNELKYKRKNKERFEHDFYVDSKVASLWYGRDLIDMILKDKMRHEIGSHSFSHIRFGEIGYNQKDAENDFRAFNKLAKSMGITPVSFVYPEHDVGHRYLLKDFGFKIYRGWTEEPYVKNKNLYRKIFRFLIRLTGKIPSIVEPTIENDGIIHMPASMHFALREGIVGKLIRWEMLFKRAKGGIENVRKRGGIFSIYFHDFNLGVNPNGYLRAMEMILKKASKLREKDELRIMTMGEIAEEIESLK